MESNNCGFHSSEHLSGGKTVAPTLLLLLINGIMMSDI
jgi:hypothetical protein